MSNLNLSEQEIQRRASLQALRDLGIDPHDEESFNTYTTDGLHFNDAGHGVIAQRLKEFIEAL